MGDLSRNGFLLLFLEGSLLAFWGNLLSSTQAVSVEEDLSLTKPETDALFKFKKAVLPILPHAYMKHDIYLIRWLRARDLNIPAAVEMLKNNLQWRRQQKMDGILQEDWSDMTTDYPTFMDTHDKADRPICTINLGTWNFRRMAIAGKMARLQRYMTKLLEEMTQQVRQQQAKGYNVTQYKLILNMDGFNAVEHACPICLPAYTSFVSNYEDYYAGWADETIHINTPVVYDIVLNLIRPLFSPATQKGVIVLGTNKAEWMAYLDKSISRDQRRVEFGGTLID